jgi:hypothetical protein
VGREGQEDPDRLTSSIPSAGHAVSDHRQISSLRGRRDAQAAIRELDRRPLGERLGSADANASGRTGAISDSIGSTARLVAATPANREDSPISSHLPFSVQLRERMGASHLMMPNDRINSRPTTSALHRDHFESSGCAHSQT